MCHPERSLSQFHRERRSRRTCGLLLAATFSALVSFISAIRSLWSVCRYNLVTFRISTLLQILKPRVIRKISKVNAPGRTVSLLRDDDLGLALQVLVLAVVVLLAMDEADHVRILLDRARLAQVAQQWLLIAATLLAGAR